MRWAPLAAASKTKPSVVECILDEDWIGAFGSVGLARHLGVTLEAVPPRLYLEGGGMTVECQLLADFSAVDCAFVHERHVARLSAVPNWICRRHPPHSGDDSSWDVVLVTLRRGCLAEALLCAALPTCWEEMIGASFVGRRAREHDSGTLAGAGFTERFSIQCGGGTRRGQVTGRITEETAIRIQRQRHACSAPDELLMSALAERREETVLVEAGSVPPSAVRAAVDEWIMQGAAPLVYHVSAVDVLCGRAKDMAGGVATVIWGLDNVCSSEDDPDEVKSAVRAVMAWLQRRPRVGGGRLCAIVHSVAKLSAVLRACFPATLCLAAVVGRDSAKINSDVQLALGDATGIDEAMAALHNLFNGGQGSVLLVGPGGTGKSMVCNACCKCVPSARGTLGTLVQCYIGASERSLGALFASARQSGALVVLDDVDTLLNGPTGRGLELQLARELQRGGCRVLLTCRMLDSALAALVGQVAELRQPDDSARRELIARFCRDAGVVKELVVRTEHFSHAECVRLGRLAKLQCAPGEVAGMAHYEAALDMMGPF